MTTATIETTDVLTRAVPGDDIRFGRDGLIRVLMVPWMTPANITEVRRGRLLEYREQFARGAFDRAEKAPHRVQLVWTHDSGFGNLLGRGVGFENDPAGAVGYFRPLPSIEDKVRDAADGAGVSVSFRPIRPQLGSERPGDLVTRAEVHLVHLAVVDNPAYEDARVLAIREADELAREEAQRRAESDAVLVQTLSMLKKSGHALSPEQERWLSEHQPSGVPSQP